MDLSARSAQSAQSVPASVPSAGGMSWADEVDQEFPEVLLAEECSRFFSLWAWEQNLAAVVSTELVVSPILHKKALKLPGGFLKALPSHVAASRILRLLRARKSLGVPFAVNCKF